MSTDHFAGFRFSLRGMLICVLAFACSLAAFKWGESKGRNDQLVELYAARGSFPASSEGPTFRDSTLTKQAVCTQFRLQVGMPRTEVTRWFADQDHTGISMHDYRADPHQGNRYIIGLADGTLTLFTDTDENIAYWCFGEQAFDL